MALDPVAADHKLRTASRAWSAGQEAPFWLHSVREGPMLHISTITLPDGLCKPSEELAREAVTVIGPCWRQVPQKRIYDCSRADRQKYAGNGTARLAANGVRAF
eukprot:6176107-Pleurochrysis_carterae.AAC.5